ncbi:MAG: hypothetical protein IKK24_00420 [Clostridia bacterium]|nr:hypothetical protein [Clostridia bacterium]
MKVYTYKDTPIKVFGLPFFEENKKLERLPEHLRNKFENLDFLGERCPGARVAFKTDAEEFTVEMKLKTLSPDVGMSIYSCQSAEVLIGERSNYRLAGLVNPHSYDCTLSSKAFKKSKKMEEITIFLPRNEIVENISVILPDNAKIEPATDYKYGPVLFYGSSITEGGHASRMSNCYNALLSNRLDFEYYNFGFSGSAKGELEIADYINKINLKLFVMDYDHNAPDATHLKVTHEPFFKRIREKNPDLPIIIMSKPDFENSPLNAERRKIIRTTFENALKAGDKNVYFIDGETFFGKKDRACCTTDTIHPNDLGFYRMAKVIEPIIRKILSIE